MTFWLDHPERHNAYQLNLHSEIAAAEVQPELSRPLVFAEAAQPNSRHVHLRELLAAVVIALVIHAGLVAVLFWPTSQTRIDAPPAAETGALFASLIPASSISLSPSAQPPRPLDTAVTRLEPAVPSLQTLTPVKEEPPPDRSKSPPPAQSALASEATLNTSNVATLDAPTFHEDADNPWEHASAPMPVLSMEEKLWAAIKPCLQESGQGSPAIRLVLDDGGRVQRMTNVEGGEAQADPRLQALARAALACAPYDHLVQSAGSYLIVAPG